MEAVTPFFSRYLIPEEQRRLLATVGRCADVLARRDAAWLRALLYSGLRIGEFSRLTVGDAQAALATGYVFVPREYRKLAGGRGLRRHQAKDHPVLLTAPLRAALEDLLRIHAEMAGDCQAPEPLVISRKGGAMTVRCYEQRCAHWAQRAGLRCSPHWLRHTRAKNILRRSTSGRPLHIVQAALGHTSLRSTGVYTLPDREELQAALDEVDGPARARRADLRRLYEQGRVS